MTRSKADQPDDCSGIEILSIEIDPSSSLVLVLAEQLGCPACGRTGDRWTIATNQNRIVHRTDRRADPGE